MSLYPVSCRLCTIGCSNVCLVLAGDTIYVTNLTKRILLVLMVLYGENVAFLTVSAMTEHRIRILKDACEYVGHDISHNTFHMYHCISAYIYRCADIT